MLIFLHGADSFSAKEKLDELKRRFLLKNNGNSFLISAISGDNFNSAEFRNKVLSAGFFAEKKMVVLNYESRIMNNGTEIFEIIKKIPEDTVLVVWLKEEDEKFLKSDLGKFLSRPHTNDIGVGVKQKYVFEFNPLSGNALVSWIRERVKNYGCEIDNEAIAEIRDILGNDLWKIDLEMQKICAYASSLFPCHSPFPCHPALDAGSYGNSGDSEIPHQVRDDGGVAVRDDGGVAVREDKKISITKKVVNELLAREAEDNIFGFIDALAAKNKRMAFLTLEEEFRAGAAELAILGAIVRQVRILLQIKSMTGSLQKDAVAKQLAIHPYVAQKSLQQVKNFQLNELKNIYRRLLEIDMAIKTSSVPARALFDRMIAKI